MAAPQMPHPGEVAALAAATRRNLSIAIHTREEIADLIAHLDSPARTTPTVIVSPRNSSQLLGVSPRKLAEALIDRAKVYVITTAALAWALDERPEYRTYGGAVRVVGRAGSGEVIRTDREPDRIIDRIVAVVDAEASRMAPAPAPATEPDFEITPTVAPTPLDLARRRTDRSAVENPPCGTEITSLRGDLASAQQLVVILEAELDAEREARTSAEHRAAAAARELTAARAEIERLRAELAAEDSPLFSDPEEQFRDDVQRSWLRTVSESERKNYPLRGFRLGPEFLSSLEMPQAPRAKIVEVVVDVLTRRAYEMASRSVRPHGASGPAGVTGQIVRSDGATGYRANIRSNTPQAPRLMWWELTDGTVELALAGRHDDPMPV